MSNRPDNTLPETAHTRWRQGWVGCFFGAWTIFAAFAVWWLLHRANGPGVSWLVGGGSAKISIEERIADWFKLADLNFHGIYPWILLAPYAAWLGSRFQLERTRWRVSLPIHLAGCALFALASHALTTGAGWGSRQVFIAYDVQTTITTNGSHRFIETSMAADGSRNITGHTAISNEITVFTNLPLSNLPTFPPEFAEKLAGLPHIPNDSGEHDSFFLKQRASQSLFQLLNVLAYTSIIGIAHMVYFHRRFRERERRAVALEAQLTKARLSALQTQLHPHFLFNALNAISTLLRRDTRAAQDALASFSELLRLALCQSTQPEVTLREDLEFLRRYVEIQQTRLGDRLRFEEHIPGELLDCLVPALLLQPLVENAIRHGIEPSTHPGTVRVLLQPQGDRLSVTVEDNGVGLSASKEGGAGIGLENLRARLESLYGAAQRVEFGPRSEGGIKVLVEFPIRRTEAAEPVITTPAAISAKVPKNIARATRPIAP